MESLDKTSLWEAVLAELQLNLSGANFQTWFKGKTRILSSDNDLIEIGCSTAYNKTWIEERYLGKLKEIIDRITGKPNALLFTVSSQESAPVKPKKPAVESQTVPLFAEAASDSIQKSIEAANINQRYHFANFVVGQTNQLAYAAAKAIAETPYERYNPLLVCGGVGVGKTHLLNAIGQAVLFRKVKSGLLYCSSETFTNEMVEAIQKRQTVGFRNRYRNCDYLLIDDVQFIAGRESTQEEFFHTFNHLYNRGKQLVFSCDRDPTDLENLQDRLKNRFIGGLVVKIEPPDLELREAILLAKAKGAGLDIDFSIIRFLAENLGPSVRDLEGSLLRLAAAAKLTGQKIDSSLVETVVGSPKKHPKKAGEIVQETASYFSLNSAALKEQNRSKALVFPRQIAMYLLRHELGLSFNEIAASFGGKDHTTVIYSVNKVEKLVEDGGEVGRIVADLRGRLSGS